MVLFLTEALQETRLVFGPQSNWESATDYAGRAEEKPRAGAEGWRVNMEKRPRVPGGPRRSSAAKLIRSSRNLPRRSAKSASWQACRSGKWTRNRFRSELVPRWR